MLSAAFASLTHVAARCLWRRPLAFVVRRWAALVSAAHRPADPASLGVVRALFGMLMMVDVVEERGLAEADVRWADADQCRFPLTEWLATPSLQNMCLVYLAMWTGALGIALGLFFHTCCWVYLAAATYLLLLDKTSWNNHSYLFALLSLLLASSGANLYCSVDRLLGRVPRNASAPAWNYAALRAQVGALYLLAGLKKLDADWLAGYSATNLGEHAIFGPARLLLSVEQIDYWLIHVAGLLLDLSTAFLLLADATRPLALVFVTAFHLANTQLFSIGMFPYVCIATLPLFCHPSWPRRLRRGPRALPHSGTWALGQRSTRRQHVTVALLLVHAALQGFLPYSHFITKGFNNWTPGMYGYSWDMMVHRWDTVHAGVRVRDAATGTDRYLEDKAWVTSVRWAARADLAQQYARCVAAHLRRRGESHLAVHVDVWTSLNGRAAQRLFDPDVDLLTAPWSPWEEVSWVKPLIPEFAAWRRRIAELRGHVHSWSDASEVLVLADFPGLWLEHFIPVDMSNVSLELLSGELAVELRTHTLRLRAGDRLPLERAAVHRVLTTSTQPSCFAYTFVRPPPGSLPEQQRSLASAAANRANGFKKAARFISTAVMNVSSQLMAFACRC